MNTWQCSGGVLRYGSTVSVYRGGVIMRLHAENPSTLDNHCRLNGFVV
ncbi:hypothetical protein NEISICOT_00226 [Neisseria sicca ATCC 29256]|uniref:Uncharacterized protein n=1 Tax=Neisseria sicca ATCC 29256 TaxID=547045 RepID=C6M146_NEISI|nr:hypothetical protein NEISICOT_00226 [Neisseria sicca ATCC 29256]